MRLHIDHTEPFIRALAECLAKDPASLKQWRCLHIQPLPEQEINSQELLNTLKDLAKYLAEVDLDMIYCSGQDVFVIGRLQHAYAMNEVQEMLTATFPDKLHFESYDLFFNWREIRKLLLAQVAHETSTVQWGDSPLVESEEVHHLYQVFNDVQKTRSTRDKLHIMVVEDDPITRRMAGNLFKSLYTVTLVEDAAEAIKAYLLNAPDIVFLDIHLPDQDGFSVLKQILACDPEAYVVMFSGNDQLVNVMHALSAGAAGFVEKPFSKEKMAHYIDDCSFARQK